MGQKCHFSPWIDSEHDPGSVVSTESLLQFYDCEDSMTTEKSKLDGKLCDGSLLLGDGVGHIHGLEDLILSYIGKSSPTLKSNYANRQNATFQELSDNSDLLMQKMAESEITFSCESSSTTLLIWYKKFAELYKVLLAGSSFLKKKKRKKDRREIVGR